MASMGRVNCSIARVFVGTYVITGGTGRLAGASGSGSTTIVPSGDNSTGTFTVSGTLSTN